MFWKGHIREVISTCDHDGILEILKTIPDEEWAKDTEVRNSKAKAGNTNLDGITDWEVGDWAVFVEVGGVDKWDKIDQTFVQGAGATGQVSFWNGINSVTGTNNLFCIK